MQKVQKATMVLADAGLSSREGHIEQLLVSANTASMRLLAKPRAWILQSLVAASACLSVLAMQGSSVYVAGPHHALFSLSLTDIASIGYATDFTRVDGLPVSMPVINTLLECRNVMPLLVWCLLSLHSYMRINGSPIAAGLPVRILIPSPRILH